MASICFFSSYSNQERIAYYIRYYLLNLSQHFTEIVLLTNEREIDQESISFLCANNIQLMCVKNEGYDFGMWYKGFMAYPMDKYNRVGLINDSAILFKPLNATFDWINNCDYDFCGLIDSIDFQYHLQSYFLILNEKAIQPTLNYFQQTGLVNGYNEVIKAYEIGLSAYLKTSGLKIGAIFNRRHTIETANPSFFMLPELIQDGIPVIKKKVIFNTYSTRDLLNWIRIDFKINPKYYIKLIKSTNKNLPLLDIAYAIEDAGYKKSQAYIYWLIFLFFTYKRIWQVKSCLYKFLKKIQLIPEKNLNK